MNNKSASMIKLVCVLVAVLFYSPALYSFQVYSGDTWATVKKNGSGTISVTYVETPAFVYRDAKGELQGICIDILNSFVSYVQNNFKVKLNVNYVGKGKNFREFYNSVQKSTGGVIGLGNVTIKEERKKEVSFTPAFIKNIAVLITHSDAPTVNSTADISTQLHGYIGVVPKGTTHEERMLELKKKYLPDLKIEYASSSYEAIERLVNEKNVICFQDIALYWDYKVKGAPVKNVSYDTGKGEELAMILPLGSDWKPLFDEFFAVGSGFKSSNIYRSSLIRHLGTEVVQMLKMAQ